MATEWNELTKMTQGKPVTVERIRVGDSGIAIPWPVSRQRTRSS